MYRAKEVPGYLRAAAAAAAIRSILPLPSADRYPTLFYNGDTGGAVCWRHDRRAFPRRPDQALPATGFQQRGEHLEGVRPLGQGGATNRPTAAVYTYGARYTELIKIMLQSSSSSSIAKAKTRWYPDRLPFAKRTLYTRLQVL